jgi:hypothetical protein
MRFLFLISLLFLFSCALSAEGDLRFRLQRRLPDCRGTLENYYSGDEFDFYSRLRFDSDIWSFILLTDKSRGEAWGDIVAGAVTVSPRNSPVSSLSAGWLKADLGSGLVLSFPGRFSSLSELSMYKPPNLRSRIEPATSPWGCRGEPVTGAAAVLTAGGFDISLLAAISSIDSLSGGYHRTSSEIAGRNAFTESLAAARIASGCWGFTAAAASVGRSTDYSWFRCGADWNINLGTLNLTGEASAGADTSSVSAAAWNSVSQDFTLFRHSLMILRNPEEFPSERTAPPVSRECDLGVCYGLRWKVFPGLAVKAGTGTYFTDGASLFLASIETEYRFPWHMLATAGLRTRSETDEFSWRGWLGGNWQPHDLINIRSKIQLSGWNSAAEDSSESGTGIELKLRYSPKSWLLLDLGSASCSTDGYNSRVYASGSSFPGVFGSTALYGRSFLFFFQVSAELSEDFFLRGAAGWKTVEDAEYLGSGWEETEGDSRTELGFQLDYAF